MLQIKQKFHLPHFVHSSTKPVAFGPVADDGDELTVAITDDPVQHDNNWQLEERPNEVQLEQYWTEVENDIQHDPTWIKFADEEVL